MRIYAETSTNYAQRRPDETALQPGLHKYCKNIQEKAEETYSQRMNKRV